MSFDVQEIHDAYRIRIDNERLELALEFFRDECSVTTKQGLTKEQQVQMFREFCADYLTRALIRQDRTDLPDIFWCSFVGRNYSRPVSLGEIQISLNSSKIYFWGHEIGRLVKMGRLRFSFGVEDESPSALGVEVDDANYDDDGEQGVGIRGC